MRVFQSKWFARFACKENIGHAALLEAVARAQGGQIDAALGGDVIKQRVARAGEGRSCGYRTIVFFRRGERAMFVYGFAKSARANIDRGEEAAFRDAAKQVLGLTNGEMAELVRRGDFVEVRAQ